MKVAVLNRLDEVRPFQTPTKTLQGSEGVSDSAQTARAVDPWPFPLLVFRRVLPYFVGFLIAVDLSVCAYWYGGRRQLDESRLIAYRADANGVALRRNADELASQRDVLDGRLRDTTKNLMALRSQKSQLELQIAALEANATNLVKEQRQLHTESDALAKRLQDSQASVASLQNQLTTERQLGAGQVATLEKRAAELSATLANQNAKVEQQEATIIEQQDLLAHDRDIRDLMGARSLYVAEVYDSDENGRPRKPYARVFYTKEKSLIFYGFDLDKQPGVTNAAAFQVWGRRGSNRENALNLGILYQDSTTNKRWNLKINDPLKLEQIDAVFVTIEPKGGSPKPTGKPLLFAYLRIDPNHP